MAAPLSPDAEALARGLAARLQWQPASASLPTAEPNWAEAPPGEPPPLTALAQPLARLRRAAAAALSLPASQLRAHHQRLLYDFALQQGVPTAYTLRALCRLAATPAGWDGRCLAANPQQLARLIAAVRNEPDQARQARCWRSLAAALPQLAASPQAAAVLQAALPAEHRPPPDR